MNNKCLVTKLSGIVDNPTLKRFGGMLINIAASETISIDASYFGGKGCSVYLKSGTVICTVGGITKTLPIVVSSEDDLVVLTASTDSVVEITSVYDITRLSMSNTNDWDVDTLNFKYSPLIQATLANTQKIHGDIKYIYKLGNTQSVVKIGHSSYPNSLVGDISVLGNCLSVKEISIRYQKGITGSVESLIAKFVKNGKTSGSITISLPGDNLISFNGVSIYNAMSDKILSWEPNETYVEKTDVTLNGTTITIDTNDYNV